MNCLLVRYAAIILTFALAPIAVAAVPSLALPFTLGSKDGERFATESSLTLSPVDVNRIERVYIAPAWAARVKVVSHRFTIGGYYSYDEKMVQIDGLVNQSGEISLRLVQDNTGSYIHLPAWEDDTKPLAPLSEYFSPQQVKQALDRHKAESILWNPDRNACLNRTPDKCVYPSRSAHVLTLTLDGGEVMAITIPIAHGC